MLSFILNGVVLALLVLGVYALVAGKLPFGSTSHISPTRARLVGLICLSPIPIGSAIVLVAGPRSHAGMMVVNHFVAPAVVLLVALLSSNVHFSAPHEQRRDSRASSKQNDEVARGIVEDPDNPFASPTREP